MVGHDPGGAALYGMAGGEAEHRDGGSGNAVLGSLRWRERERARIARRLRFSAEGVKGSSSFSLVTSCKPTSRAVAVLGQPREAKGVARPLARPAMMLIQQRDSAALVLCSSVRLTPG